MTNTADGSLGGGSLLHNVTQSSFDVRKEEDVIALLRTVHMRPIEPTIKNHLRDLLFAYRQSMLEEDAEKVRQGFLPLGISIESEARARMQQTVVPKKNTWGATRPAPNFKEQKKSEAATSAQEVAEPVSKKAPVFTPQSIPKVDPATLQTQVPAPKVATPVQSVPTAAAPEVAAIATIDVASRIKEIKRLVNQQVGNPVNLIDEHNEIGREYMNALLQAMKTSNGGSQAEVAQAMDRLEKAFASVQQILDKTKAAPPATNSTPEPQPEPIQVAKPPVPNADVVAEEKHEKELPVVEPTQATPAPLESTPLEEKIVPPPMPSAREVLTPVEKADTPPVAQPQSGGMHSVAKEKQLQDLLKANREKEALTQKQQEDAKIASMDPLLAPAVTSGLQQLLSEWSLFKSSGIFGTGPSGKDHPLYKKIAPLTMAAVIAGRFEGATAQIKQSITDYMNGWRYEEGVVHEHGETFEHYLRRVVNHILNKQKQK